MDLKNTQTEQNLRAALAGEVARRMEQEYLESFCGTIQDVLFEEEKNGLWRGHTTRYLAVEVPAAEDLHNRVRPVRLETEKGDFLWGTLIKTPGLDDV